MVSAKYPPMVKLEKSLIHNSRVSKLGGNCAYFRLWGFWGFYSSVGPKSMPWSRSSFLIGENLFNPCIFWNPFLVGVSWLEVRVGRKIFPYTCMRGDQARPCQTRQRFIYPLQLILFNLSSSAYCHQLTVFSLWSSTYYLQLTVFSLLCPKCSH